MAEHVDVDLGFVNHDVVKEASNLQSQNETKVQATQTNSGCRAPPGSIATHPKQSVVRPQGNVAVLKGSKPERPK